jgi:hypothetical protein
VSLIDLNEPKEQLENTLVANVETGLNTSNEPIKNRSHQAYNDLDSSVNKSCTLSGENWLHSFDLVPTSRRINILRKRVCTGGAQLQEPSKKVCKLLPNAEVSPLLFFRSIFLYCIYWDVD